MNENTQNENAASDLNTAVAQAAQAGSEQPKFKPAAGSGFGWINESGKVENKTLGEQVRLLAKATRSGVVLVMILPVVLGTLLATAVTHQFNFFTFVLTVVGAAAAHLASNTVNDYWDYKSGADTLATESEGEVATHSGVLVSGVMTTGQVGLLTAILFAVALACGVGLAFLTGWQVLIFAVLGFLLAYFYVAPPIAYGYIGRGLGEIGVLFSFGVLPVMGAYYTQTGVISWAAFLASLPTGLLTTAILLNHSFLQWRADKLANKNTPVVAFGVDGALKFSWVIAISAYVSLLVGVLLGVFPWFALLALISFPIVAKGLQAAQQIKAVPGYGQLMAATFQSDVLTGALIAVSLLAATFIGSFSFLTFLR